MMKPINKKVSTWSREEPRLVVTFLVITLLFPWILISAPINARGIQASDDSVKSVVKGLGKGIYQIGTLTIDSTNKEIRIPGRVNMDKGMIELLACARGGKLHESVLVLDVIPEYLHVALLLLGLNPGGGPQFHGDPRQPLGDSVNIFVRWKSGDASRAVPAEDLLWDVARDVTMQHTAWVFIGSKFVNGKYMSNLEKTLITTYHDPYAILENPLPTGINHDAYRVNEKLIPPSGTPVEVIIRGLEETR